MHTRGRRRLYKLMRHHALKSAGRENAHDVNV